MTHVFLGIFRCLSRHNNLLHISADQMSNWIVQLSQIFLCRPYQIRHIQLAIQTINFILQIFQNIFGRVSTGIAHLNF
jgi:hypothetical protein